MGTATLIAVWVLKIVRTTEAVLLKSATAAVFFVNGFDLYGLHTSENLILV